MNNRLYIWGSPPPPLGGMSVHISRLEVYLAAKGIDCVKHNFRGNIHPDPTVVNVSSFASWYLKVLFNRKIRVHYVITSNYFVRFLAAMLAFVAGKRVIIRVGGESLEKAMEVGGFARLLSKFALRYCTKFIGVNEEIVAIATEVKSFDDVYKVPGFIFPILHNNEQDLDDDISHFLEDKFSIIFSGRVFERSQRDIYGTWLLLEAVINLRKEGFTSLRLVFCLYEQDDTDDIEGFKRFVVKNKLEDFIMILEDVDNLIDFYKVGHLYVRPSITDGDSNALREGLYCRIPCLASDVVKRPDGCILFKNASIEDLQSKIIEIYENYELVKSRSLETEIENNGPVLAEIVSSLFESDKNFSSKEKKSETADI
ncbi:glycosyltransferase [Roseivirga sp. E12]|uniref:glycosyltransferase n=1 Tax=Roseivirga sp. E12 TaxID=2819237 RepID=UPI001ABD2AC9|nr:glycosyltransferase [Roseivirga sp. E12]MBO3699747.1 glycosyltransferase family 4 protein [Roseivirga sp. E12]